MSISNPKRLYTFQVADKLKSRKLIQEAFLRKNCVIHFPIKLFYLPVDINIIPSSSQFAVIVPKKQFPKASDRNRIKRLLKEAIRHQKPSLDEKLEQNNKKYVFLCMYQDTHEISYQEIYFNLEKAIHKLWNRI